MRQRQWGFAFGQGVNPCRLCADRGGPLDILSGLQGLALRPTPKLPRGKTPDVDVELVQPWYNPVTEMYWLNVSALMDPVSARLRFYTCNREVRRNYRIWGISHTRYWHDAHFYDEVLAALNQGHCSNELRRAQTLKSLPPL